MPPRLLTGLLVLAATLSAGATTSCGIVTPPASGAPKRAARTTPVAEPAVSPAESQRVLSGFVTRQNKAVLAGDGAAWRAGLTGSLEATAGAALRANQGRPPDRGQLSLLAPVLHVPRLDRYPKWFAAAATEQRVAPEGRTRRAVLLLFVRTGDAGRWLAAHRLYLPRGTKPPRAATDDQGYAAVPGAADKLAISPDRVAAAHSDQITGRDNGPLFAAGPYTSGLRDAARRAATTARAAGGNVTLTVAPAKNLPPYALRAAGGGALVWYVLDELETRTGPAAASVPRDVSAYLAGRTGAQVKIRRLRPVLAHIRPKGDVQVLGTAPALVAAAVA